VHLKFIGQPRSEPSGFSLFAYLQGNFVYFENVGGTGTVTLNGRDAKRGDKALLKSGDELAFTGSKHSAYVSFSIPCFLCL
jgi:hypothetical protein